MTDIWAKLHVHDEGWEWFPNSLLENNPKKLEADLAEIKRINPRFGITLYSHVHNAESCEKHSMNPSDYSRCLVSLNKI